MLLLLFCLDLCVLLQSCQELDMRTQICTEESILKTAQQYQDTRNCELLATACGMDMDLERIGFIRSTHS